MTDFATLPLPKEPTALAPDGSEVRLLLGLARGGMAHFSLKPGQVSHAVTHRTVEEIWYVTEGRGELWRKHGAREEIVPLEPGLCVSVPLGTHFQFRAARDRSLGFIGITMPPWPGPDEAVPVVGPWPSRS